LEIKNNLERGTALPDWGVAVLCYILIVLMLTSLNGGFHFVENIFLRCNIID
jgi:hypothetical protein